MLENLFNLVKEHAGDAIINNNAIPNEKNDAAISNVSDSIFNSLKNQVAGGNINDVMALLSGKSGEAGNNVVNAVSGDAEQNLAAKFGLSSGAAGSIVSSLLPVVMKKLVSKTNDPNDNSFDLKGILGSLAGGNSKIDIGSILNQASSGGAQNAGIGGMLGKIFGK